MDPAKLDTLKLPELRQELKSRGLITKGTKAQLTQRLKEALESDKKPSSTVAGSQKPAIEKKQKTKEEDDEVVDVEGEEEDVLATPLVAKSKLSTNSTTAAKPLTSSAKQAPLNVVSASGIPTPSGTVNGDSSNEVAQETKIVSLSAVNSLDEEQRKAQRLQKFQGDLAPVEEDKLAKRRQRFGLITEDDKKKQRAQRFGIPKSSLTTTNGEKTSKKVSAREQRLGIPLKNEVGKQISNRVSSDEVEARKKRAARFGTSEDKNTTEEQRAKKKLRAERFSKK